MKLRLLSTIVLWFAFFSVASSVTALEPALATDDTSSLNLGRYIEILEDPTGVLTIDEVSSPAYGSKFTFLNKDVINLGYTASAYWVRLSIQNLSLQDESWLLEARPANINHIEVYKPLAGGGFAKTKTGVTFPVSTREMRYHRFVFQLPLPFHQVNTFYLRLQNDSSLILDLRLIKAAVFTDRSTSEFFILGLFYGIMLIMLIYNLFLYFSLKDASYLYYVFFIFCFLLWNLLFEGVGQLYLFPEGFRLNQKYLLLALTVSGLLLLSFAKSFLNLKSHLPRIGRIITVWQLTIGAVLALLIFFSYGTIARVLSLLAVSGFSIILVSAFWVCQQGYKPARFFIAAWGIFILGFTLFIAVRLGVAPINSFYEIFYQIGIVWMTTMLSVALADSINALKDKAEKANRDLQQSERLFKAIFDQTYQLIGLLSPNGMVMKVNETALHFVNISETEIKGKPFWEGPWWSSPEQKAEIKRAVERAAQGEFVRFETVHADYLGKPHTIDFSLKPILDETDKVTLLIPEGRDITERKAMENAIRESEAKYRALVDLAQDGIVVLQEGLIRFVNPYLVQMTGYQESELIEANFRKLVNKERSKEIIDRFLIESRSKSIPAIYETTFIHKDGSERYIEYNSIPIDYQGQAAWLVFIRNIHSRKLAELELKKSKVNLETSEQKYQLLFDRSVVGMFTSRVSDGKIISSNKAANLIFGLRSGNISIEPFRTIELYTEKSDRLRMLKQLFKEKALNNYQVKLKKINGKEFWAEFSIRYYPAQDLIEGTIKDITKQKEAEEVVQRSQDELNKLVKDRTAQLEASQTELMAKTAELELFNQKLQATEYQTRSILQNSPDYIFNVDPSCAILYINRAIKNLDPHAAIGINILDLTPPAFRRLLKDSITRVFAFGFAETIEISLDLAEVDDHWFEVRFVGLKQEMQVFQVMIIATDITKRMLAEHELAEAQRMAIDKAHKAGMADIASGILHNVGNLLNSVNTSIHVMREVLRESALVGLNQANTILSQNLNTLETFIANDPKGKLLFQYYLKVGDLLTDEQSKIVHNTNRVKEKLDIIAGVIAAQQSFAAADSLTEKHSLVAIIEDVLLIHSGSMERSGITIVREFCELPKIPVQKAKLVHVLITLLDNATESILFGRQEPKRIVISITHSHNDVMVKIKDTGIGIPQELLKKIFMHGYKNAKNQQCFGLHSSAIYMSEMSGEIWAESEGINRGATFVVKLPVRQANLDQVTLT